jgi:hypothetical protein
LFFVTPAGKRSSLGQRNLLAVPLGQTHQSWHIV